VDETLVESKSARDLIRSLIERNPSNRISLEQVLHHRWILEKANHDETYMNYCSLE
jgi:serine/threonine protein kinase